MNLLLDTHTVLWWLSDDDRLGEQAADAIAGNAGDVLISAVVVWEISIKTALGKLDAPDDVADLMLGAGARELPVRVAHAAAVRALPPHHADPFDRLLIAQARVEHAVIVSGDPAITRYDVPVLW